MFHKLIPRNNEWNRKYSFIDETGTGFLMDWKLGQAFFAWKFSEEQIKFYKCEQEVFEKNFSVTDQKVEHEFDPYDTVHFLRYPMEV
ncbi:MAG: hypothetical protein ABI855_13860 [Bacteroidota bacterium]